MTTALVAWLGVPTAALVAAVVSMLPRLSPVVRAVPAVVLMAVVVGSSIFHFRPSATDATPGVGAALAIAVLGVVAGSAVTSAVLSLAMHPTDPDGPHGGIIVTPDPPADQAPSDHVGPAASAGEQLAGSAPVASVGRSEVLRGGAAIGYLERSAVIGAALMGHLEVLAAVIAVKGLGRFTELDTAEARERFIIGTLASTLWAGCAAAAVLLP